MADIDLVYRATTGRKIPPADPTRIGVCRTASWSQAEPAARQAVEDAAETLAAAGIEVSDVTLPGEFDEIEKVFRVISNFEGKQSLVEEFRDHAGTMNFWLRETCESSWTHEEYGEALVMAARARDALGEIFAKTPVLLTPSTAGEAPADLKNLTISSFNRLWTLMHGPAMTLPVAKGPSGMPLGVQLVGRRGEDAALIAQAALVETAMGTTAGRI